ncbi:hypothetical protein ABTZ03_28570 [Kitasatospora sp. NPDC096077]|uniref:hypothetical protein n=1 Tax=Kitasatospora sp. NPDC096077 TaxID=3155544 RepID=UPI00332450DB
MSDDRSLCTLTTSPPEFVSSTTGFPSIVDLHLVFSVPRWDPSTEITVTLPIGSAPGDLLPDQAAADAISVIVSDNRNERDGRPVWRVTRKASQGRYAITCRPDSAVGAFLRLSLSGVRINQAPGEVKIDFSASSDAGHVTPDLPPLVKYPSGFYFGDLTCPDPALNGTARLHWRAHDVHTADGFVLEWNGSTRTLDSDARSVAVTGLANETTFTLTATERESPDTRHTLTVTVPVPTTDETLTQLTVGGTITFPGQNEVNSRTYVLEASGAALDFTAPADGYYTIEFTTAYRVLRLLPILREPGVTGTHDVKITVTHAGQATTFTRRTSDGRLVKAQPSSFFAPAGAKLTLVAEPDRVEQLWRSTATELKVTWQGPNGRSGWPEQPSGLLDHLLPIATFPTFAADPGQVTAVLSGEDRVAWSGPDGTLQNVQVPGLRYVRVQTDTMTWTGEEFATSGVWVSGDAGTWDLRSGVPSDPAARSATLSMGTGTDRYQDPNLEKGQGPQYTRQWEWGLRVENGKLLAYQDMKGADQPTSWRCELTPFKDAAVPKLKGCTQMPELPTVCWQDGGGTYAAGVDWKGTTQSTAARRIEFFHHLLGDLVLIGEQDGTIGMAQDTQPVPLPWNWKTFGIGVPLTSLDYPSDSDTGAWYITQDSVYDLKGNTVRWPDHTLSYLSDDRVTIDRDGVQGLSAELHRKSPW